MPSSLSDASPATLPALGIGGLMVMYVGNLEPYQGIDLLLASFAHVCRRTDGHALVIIGGTAREITTYRAASARLGIGHRVHFLGPRPVRELARHLTSADVLVSPRLHGENTPMKLYSYLHSGKPLVATALPTHTQLVDGDVALLAAPIPEAFGDAMVTILRDASLRARLGEAGQRFVEARFTYHAFRERLGGLIDWLEGEASRSSDAAGSRRPH